MREKCTNKGKREAKIEAKPDRGATVTPERKVREEIFPLIKRDTDIKDMSNVTYKHESGGSELSSKRVQSGPPDWMDYQSVKVTMKSFVIVVNGSANHES